ncbi:MAG: hypothetical protein EXQ93_03370 [Alphaproteobacteria bacterium]|nr:hypothetical protein [Alphaproteobacteria bacterium]
MHLLEAARAIRRAGLSAACCAVAAVAIAGDPMAAIQIPVPCAGESPAYPAVDQPADIRVVYYDALGPKWAPAPCTGWKESNVAFLITTAGRFHHAGSIEEIAARLGTISSYHDILYWSHSRQAWRPIMPEAFALAGPDPASKRGNFTAAEMLDGAPRYFWQSASGKFAYRLQVMRHDDRSMVIEMENVTGLQMLLLPVFRPGDARMQYYVGKESGDVWHYYSMIAVSGPFSSLLRSGEESFVNRAGAIYRYFAGIPTDQEPPPIR